jgi:hypothetical protein
LTLKYLWSLSLKAISPFILSYSLFIIQIYKKNLAFGPGL